MAQTNGDSTACKPRLATKLILIPAFLLAFAIPRAWAQSSPAQNTPGPELTEKTSPLPQFEVASVRPSGPNQREINGLYTYPGGRVVARGATLGYLLMEAFNLRRYQISGGPKWIDDERYEIQAKPPESSPSSNSNPVTSKSPPNDEQRQMLESLLIDRFQLKFHRTTKEGTVFILARGNKALKLQPPKDTKAFSWAGAVTGGWFFGGIRGENISMPQLATRLSHFLGSPVLDQTGIPGSFDFEYQTGEENNDADIPGFLLTAMKEIGLKLSSGKGPVETIVIDSADKPTEN
jgi:uncharacterized protein (TIGR03435 family)